jgi:hypothetical protein
LRIDRALLAVAEIGDGFRFAEINAAGELAQDNDIEALDGLALQTRSIGQRRINDGGANIGEQPKLFAQAQQPRLRPRLERHLVPFRPAYRAEDHGVAGMGLGHGRFGNGDLVRVIAGATDQVVLGLEIGNAFLGVEAEQPLHLGHDFRADAVAGEQKEIVGRHKSRLITMRRRLLMGRVRLGKARRCGRDSGLRHARGCRYCPLNQL